VKAGWVMKWIYCRDAGLFMSNRFLSWESKFKLATRDWL
jgi:hypothetical protein